MAKRKTIQKNQIKKEKIKASQEVNQMMAIQEKADEMLSTMKYSIGQDVLDWVNPNDLEGSDDEVMTVVTEENQ